jgi:outer membrane lipoprotein-sorting protein
MMTWRLLVIVGTIGLMPTLALAEASNVCSRLEKVARAAQKITDQEYISTFTYREKGRVVKTFKMRIITKGMHKALVSFLAPGDLRGTRILVANPETMYVYIPEFRRVRRIAGHSLRQSFMGTNIYYEDIVERQYSERWNCRHAKTTQDSWLVDLRPKSGIQTAYSKLRLTIAQKGDRLSKIQYYEGSKHVRTQERDSWETKEGLELASRMKYVSHDRDADLTLQITEWRTNIGLPDSAFTRRSLLQGF